MNTKNLEKRISEIEKVVKNQDREEFVHFIAKNPEEFERQKAEYLKSNPEPEIFVCIIDFAELYEIYDRGGDVSEWSFYKQNDRK